MFTITTDSAADFTRSKLEELNMPCLPLTYTIDGVSYDGIFDSDAELIDFYDKLGKGAMPLTSQISPSSHEEFFDKIIKERGADILHICLSSGLSKTYESALLGADAAMKKHKGVTIEIVDSKTATVPTQPLLYKAKALQSEGASVKSAAEKVRKYSESLHVYIIPDDLFHLKRGGRVSAAAAVLGSVLKIKPILLIGKDGKLPLYKKSIGFNNAVKTLVEHAVKYANSDKPHFYIAHSNAIPSAQILEKQLLAAFPTASVETNWIGTVVGSHVGTGTIGLVFDGNTPRLL